MLHSTFNNCPTVLLSSQKYFSPATTCRSLHSSCLIPILYKPFREELQHFNLELLWVPCLKLNSQLKVMICDGNSESLQGYYILGDERDSGKRGCFLYFLTPNSLLCKTIIKFHPFYSSAVLSEQSRGERSQWLDGEVSSELVQYVCVCILY